MEKNENTLRRVLGRDIQAWLYKDHDDDDDDDDNDDG
jgi:hypothetical protein